MLKRSILEPSKAWFRFTRTTSNGEKLRFRWEPLPEDRFEEFVDFAMKYYVTRELGHRACEISKNPESMKEYRPILSKMYQSPLYHTSICCLDNETNDIVAFDSLKLCKKGETYEEPELTAQTPEVKKLLHINEVFVEKFPTSRIMDKFGVNKFFDDGNAAAHPALKAYRMTIEISQLRHMVCKTHGVSLTGAWMTSKAVQLITANTGWEIVHKFSVAEIKKLLNVKFEKSAVQSLNIPEHIIYKVLRVS